jgi:hypothetical protein
MGAWWERRWAPEWAGGWTLARVLFALAALYNQLLRYPRIDDAYASTDMIFSYKPFYLADHFVLTPATGHALWWTGFLALLALLWGGRLAKPALLIWLLSGWVLLSMECFNTKAYDRLMTWQAIALLLGPIGERGLSGKARSPLGRWWLLVTYCCIYGSTGYFKARYEPLWWTGEALQWHLVLPYFGQTVVGAWMSDKLWITWPLCVLTVLGECGFPLLIWFRRTNPWILTVMVGFHLGILVTMNVGVFSHAAIALYPVLLHPEVARKWWLRWEAWRGR